MMEGRVILEFGSGEEIRPTLGVIGTEDVEIGLNCKVVITYYTQDHTGKMNCIDSPMICRVNVRSMRAVVKAALLFILLLWAHVILCITCAILRCYTIWVYVYAANILPVSKWQQVIDNNIYRNEEQNYIQREVDTTLQYIRNRKHNGA